MKKKTIALLVAVTMIVGIAVGGTLAWLKDSTGPVVNTFTTSDVNIDLTESDNLDLVMVPGKTLTKDPKVTVLANSEKSYVFVQIEKSANYDTYLSDYTVATGWTLVDGTTDVYYRVADKAATNQEFAVLNNNQVTVKGSVTKTEMEALTAANYPTLTFTAYAIQFDYLTGMDNIAAIWAEAQTVATP